MGDGLNCIISEGQFSGEFAVQGEMFDSTGFSLFLPQRDLFFSKLLLPLDIEAFTSLS